VKALLALVVALFFAADAGAFQRLGEIRVDHLPREARVTLQLIQAGGPFRYEKDGAIFSNREGLLPPRRRGHYREYTVNTPGSRDRGARRIIAGHPDEFYYTEDHYRTFRRIVE
jgi:ribonuclease T1